MDALICDIEEAFLPVTLLALTPDNLTDTYLNIFIFQR